MITSINEYKKYLVERGYNRALYDRPYSVIKSHPDYNMLVEWSKQNDADPEKLKGLLISWFARNEKHLAQTIFCSDNEEYIYCDHATDMLHQIFTDAGIEHSTQVGVINGQSHAWARIGNTIIDPTSSQLSDTKLSTYDTAKDLSTHHYEKGSKIISTPIIDESLDTEKIWSGEEVNNHITQITPNESDVPDHFMDKLIIHRQFKIQSIDLNNLLATDPSFKEYYDSGEERYDDDSEHQPHYDDLNNEIVVVDGVLLDGYSRCSTLLRMGETHTNGFVAI